MNSGPKRIGADAAASDHAPPQMVRAVAAEIVARWLAALDAAGPPEARLRQLADAHLRLVAAAPELPGLLMSRALSGDTAALAVPRHLISLLRLLIEGTIEAGQLTGRFRAEADPREAAQALIGAIQAVVLRWLLTGRRFALAEGGQRALTAILRGLAADEPRRGGRLP